MRIVIDTLPHPRPAELVAQLEAVLSVHDPDAQVTVAADPDRTSP